MTFGELDNRNMADKSIVDLICQNPGPPAGV